jgi:hypothetical protein
MTWGITGARANCSSWFSEIVLFSIKPSLIISCVHSILAKPHNILHSEAELATLEACRWSRKHSGSSSPPLVVISPSCIQVFWMRWDRGKRYFSPMFDIELEWWIDRFYSRGSSFSRSKNLGFVATQNNFIRNYAHVILYKATAHMMRCKISSCNS